MTLDELRGLLESKAALSPKEYGDAIGCHVSTVWLTLQNGELPAAFRVGRHWKIPTAFVRKQLGLEA